MNAPQTNVKSVWTKEDEARFLEMSNRRERIMQENRGPVSEIAGKILEELRTTPAGAVLPKMVDELVARADDMVKVLKPFCLE